MAIAIATVRQMNSQTATNSALAMSRLIPHPLKSRITRLLRSNTLRFRSKSCTPHFRQHIQVAFLRIGKQTGSIADVLFGLRPMDVSLEQ